MLISGIAVDANVMNLFILSYIAGDQSNARVLVERIERGKGFAIDEKGKIERQWLDTCGGTPGSPFFEWFYQKLKVGSVRTVSAALDHACRKKLRIECGFPNDRYEITYIEVANVTEDRYVVSEDIHFYDPRLKRANEAAKSRAKAARRGEVCRHLRHIQITVGTIMHALAEIQ